MHPTYWHTATRHLTSRDPIMGELIRQYQGETLTSHGDGFTTLSRSIVGQQISVKAAATIWARLENAAGDFIPASIERLTDEELRTCGLSGQKVTYLREIARFFTDQSPDWHNLPDEEVLRILTGIKGVGKWTAEMFMIFHLQRPDIFPIADIGLLKAIYRHYNDANPMDKAEVLALAKQWQPYRTVATWYLWRALDPVPVAY